MFERSLERMFALMEDTSLTRSSKKGRMGQGQMRTSGRRKAELPGELEWPLQTPEDVERLEEILSQDKGRRKATVSCWKFLKDAVTKCMPVTEIGRGVF